MLVLTILEVGYGDANLDGVVNDEDTALLTANWQRVSGATWGEGDFNEDSAVNDEDATILATNWQSSGVSQASAPEPSMLVLLAGMLLVYGEFKPEVQRGRVLKESSEHFFGGSVVETLPGSIIDSFFGLGNLLVCEF